MITFGMVGASNAAVDFVVLAALLWLVDPGTTLALLACNTVAFVAAATNSFLLNSRVTFRSPRPLLSHSFMLFMLINCGSLVLSNVSLLAFKGLIEGLLGVEGRAAILLAKPPGGVLLAVYAYLSYRKLFLGRGPLALAGSLLRARSGLPGPGL